MSKYNLFGYSGKSNMRVVDYTVQKGDNLYSIAKKYGVSLDDLMESNNLESSVIYPNQVIVIPKQVYSGAIYFEEYVIQDGDTIESISEKYNIDVDTLGKYNDISKLILKENQTISIPKEYKTYTVLSTDTVDTILDATNMSAFELLTINKDKWLPTGTVINIK